MVERLGATEDKALASESPVLLVEVLSPSSEERDLSAKPTEYLSLASLQAYIVVSQDEPLCYVWLRNADGKFRSEPETFKGRDQIIPVAALGITLPLAEVYRGIEI